MTIFDAMHCKQCDASGLIRGSHALLLQAAPGRFSLVLRGRRFEGTVEAIQQGFVLVRYRDRGAGRADGEAALAQWLPYAESAVARMQALQVSHRQQPADAVAPKPWTASELWIAGCTGHGAQKLSSMTSEWPQFEIC